MNRSKRRKRRKLKERGRRKLMMKWLLLENIMETIKLVVWNDLIMNIFIYNKGC